MMVVRAYPIATLVMSCLCFPSVGVFSPFLRGLDYPLALLRLSKGPKVIRKEPFRVLSGAGR